MYFLGLISNKPSPIPKASLWSSPSTLCSRNENHAGWSSRIIGYGWAEASAGQRGMGSGKGNICANTSGGEAVAPHVCRKGVPGRRMQVQTLRGGWRRV